MLEQLRIDPKSTSTPVGTAMLLAITALTIYLCWTMVAPFVGALTWAAALAIVAHPLQRWMLRHVPRTAAALIIVAVVVVCAAAFAFFMSQRLIHEFVRGQQALRDLLARSQPL